MRSNQRPKNVDSGGLVGVVISSTTTWPPGLTTREISRAGGHVEQLRARADLGQVDCAPAPAVVQAGGHDRVHRVVRTRDAIEHGLDLTLLQGARLGSPRLGPGHREVRYLSVERN